MSTPYLGEIRIFSFAFAPRGWALANGQTMAINQNQALFALLGTTYGGNGQTNFSLPNLAGRVAMGAGNTYTQGEAAGEAAHTLSFAEMPLHNHVPNASNAPGAQPGPAGNYWASDSNHGLTFGTSANATLAAAAIANAGSSQPHSNMMPYLALNFCIALQGIFPSRS
jgi:microcystin-dependent protein